MSAQESILIVDDNVDASHLLCVLLEQLGERATCRENGREGLEYLKTHVPRLILLDAVMPGMNGIEVLQAIRKDPRLAAVPVIIMSRTAHDPGIAQYAREQGAAEFWIKSEMLYKNLKQLLAPYLPRVSVRPRSGSTRDEVESGDSGKSMN
jgi:CheY-like chemotaxis protein